MARKVAEIADSDGESEVDVAPALPQLPSILPPDLSGTTPETPDIDLGVNFSDFLSQSQTARMVETQCLHTHKEQAEEAKIAEPIERAENSTGTTASLKRQIESEQRRFAELKESSSALLSNIRKPPNPHSSDSPTVAKTKRRRSELVATGQIDIGRDTKRKRHNTYGSSGSSRLRSSQIDMFDEEPQLQNYDQFDYPDSNNVLGVSSHRQEHNQLFSDQQTDTAPELLRNQIGHCAHSNSGEDALHSHNHNTPGRDKNSRLELDPLKEHMQMSSGGISTSRSLMGNHESIILDYSDIRAGLDVNANPFTDGSQKSVEGHYDGTEPKSLEEIFRPSSRTNVDTLPASDDHEGHKHKQAHSHRFGMDEPPKLQDDYSHLVSRRSKSFVDPSMLLKNSLDDVPALLGPRQSSPMKRRKTVDGLALSVTPTAYEMDSISTVGAAPDAPEHRAETQGKKRGRKPKNRIVETNDHLTSEHHHGQDGTEDDGDLAKRPSSELHLDDELAIGLPQEQYKPRPSRSRSKRTTELEMPPPSHTPISSVHAPTKQTRTPSVDDTAPFDELEDTPLTKLKKDKKKKNKMKRAKTSAAALLKKSDKMLSDGEEDVIWVDSKPATVKMKLPDPFEVKQEESEMKEQPAPESNVAEAANTIAGKKQPVVDGPSEAADPSIDGPLEEEVEEQPAKPPPKKRGRKKKITIELPGRTDTEESRPQTAQEAEKGPSAEEDQNHLPPKSQPPSSHRQALSEKDANTWHAADITTSTTSIPPKPSTIKYPPTHTPSPTKAAASPNEPGPETPQSKSTTDSNSMGGIQGPTRHSPINPTGGKVKYRVGLSRRAAIPPLLKVVRK